MPNTRAKLHWESFVMSVLVPIAFVIIMNGIEGLFQRLTLTTWTERWMKISWDLCVLALGLAGGILASPEVSKCLGTTRAMCIALVIITAALGSAVMIGYWRADDPKGWMLWASIGLSGGILAVLSFIALAYERLGDSSATE